MFKIVNIKNKYRHVVHGSGVKGCSCSFECFLFHLFLEIDSFRVDKECD